MFKRILFYPATFFLIILSHIAVKKFIVVAGVSPNLIFLAVIFIGLFKGPLQGELWGFTLGIVSDAFLIGLFGSNAFCYTLVGFISGLMKKKLDAGQYRAQMFFALIISIFYSVVFIIINSIFSEEANIFSFKNLWLLPILNSLSAPAAYYLFNEWVKLWFGPFRRG